MPTYEYCCSKCDHTFELFQPISDRALSVCPADLCALKQWGRGRVKRVIGTGAGIIFKGSGFYSTDYRSENYKAAAKKESDSKSPPAGEGTGKPAKSEPKNASPAPKTPASSS
ncbi:MAG: zinc ribbon domain-containing protein [Verrucomicrobia bacterium]|nr:zinc ribbon domain-containing protein [Verrucomicrobiota bacterium]